MAKSSARKQRERMVKQGKSDPSMLRGTWGLVNPMTRVKPNKKKEARDYGYDRAFNTLSVVS